MATSANDPWHVLWSRVDEVRGSLDRVKSVRVRAETPRLAARATVDHYFREARPALLGLGVGEAELDSLDTDMHALLGLANGESRKTAYGRILKSLRVQRPIVEARRNLLIGTRPATPRKLPRTGVEELIIATLSQLTPSGALSYQQAILDLQDEDRRSWRGTAQELRETLRDVLNHLAPDDEVVKTPDFRPEKDEHGRERPPTMRQKALFILRARGLPGNALKAPQQVATLFEETAASLARSVYDRGSIVAHVASARQGAQQMKLYLDTLLSELLQVHR